MIRLRIMLFIPSHVKRRTQVFKQIRMIKVAYSFNSMLGELMGSVHKFGDTVLKLNRQ